MPVRDDPTGTDPAHGGPNHSAPNRSAPNRSATPASPAVRRLQPPSWLDLRLVIGVLLVLVAIVVGARVLAGADRSTTVWGLSRDVAGGTTLQAGDLRKVRIRFFDGTGQYLPTTSTPVGLVTARDLRAGELLPRPALQRVPPSVLVPVPVEPAQLPPELAHGSRVDLWAGPKNATGGPPRDPVLVLAGAAVQSVDSSGSRLSSTSAVQVTVRIDPADEQKLVRAIAGSTIYPVQALGGPGSPGR